MKVTRGMQRQSAKLARRSEVLGSNALVAGIDIAKRESVVVFVRASDRVPLGQMRIPTSAAGAQELISRGERLARQAGLERLVLGMEATGSYWKHLARVAADLGVRYAVVQSFVLARSREFEDLTRDKNDLRDARLIGNLVAELRFTETQLDAGAWAQLRTLAEARDQRRVERTAAFNEQRALLDFVWPELLASIKFLDGSHLQACLRTGLTPAEISGMCLASFCRRLRREYGAGRFMTSVAQRIWQLAQGNRAWDETAAVMLRLQLAAERVRAADRAIEILDTRMLAALELTGLGWMRGQIRGLGDVLLVNLLALSGDPRRFDDSGCMVKLAGSNPTERNSGQVVAGGAIPRRGRRTLRLLAFQAATCVIRHNLDFKRRQQALTSRQHKKLNEKSAQMAVANKLLRILWAMAVSGQPYDSELAVAGRLGSAAA